MSEQDKQPDAEQIASQSADSLPDGTSTTEQTESLNTSELVGEESKQPVEQVNDVANEQRQKQITTWEEREAKGEIKRDEMPKWVQKAIDEREAGYSNQDYDKLLNEGIDKKFAEIEDAKKYTSITSKLETVKVTKEQKERLINRFNSLKGKIMNGEALEIACEAAGISFSATSESKVRPKSMYPPANPTKDNANGISEDMSWKEAQKTYSEEDRRKNLLKAVRG